MADDDSKKVDSNRVVAFSLLGIAFVVFLLMGLEIGVNTEENMDSGPVWWQVGPHAVGTLDKLTSDSAEVKTVDEGTQTFEVTNHTMMVAFGGQIKPGEQVLVKYLNGHDGKVARVIRTLPEKDISTASSASSSTEPSGSPASAAPASGSPDAASTRGSGSP